MGLLLGAVLSLGTVSAADSGSGTWLRGDVEDAILVQRSELVVIGSLRRGSVAVVDWEGRGGHEHTATLLVTQVLKGKAAEKELPIIIHYGLCPVVGGIGCGVDLRGGNRDYPADIIEILDTGGGFCEPLVRDAGENGVWFLRRNVRQSALELEKDELGIIDPEEVQPMSHKEYLLTYLEENPEARIRAMVSGLPPIAAQRAKRYLTHCEVVRISKIKDPFLRIERLVPFFLGHQRWNHAFEARDLLVGIGSSAGPRLVPFFADPNRSAIAELWGEIRWRNAVPILIDLLRKLDRYWAGERLEEGWWNHDLSSATTRTRRENYGLVHSAVVALGELREPAAKEAIEMTLARWQTLDPHARQMIEDCEEALVKLSSRKK